MRYRRVFSGPGAARRAQAFCDLLDERMGYPRCGNPLKWRLGRRKGGQYRAAIKGRGVIPDCPCTDRHDPDLEACRWTTRTAASPEEESPGVWVVRYRGELVGRDRPDSRTSGVPS